MTLHFLEMKEILPHKIMNKYNKINYANIFKLLVEKEGYELLSEYKNAHIKGAKNIPLKEFASGIDNYSKFKDKPVLIYCNSGNTATRALKLLKNAGFREILIETNHDTNWICVLCTK